ncbi:MAG: hypothetical protein ABEI06_10185, partial [Halobacteriaceae archaeon]
MPNVLRHQSYQISIKTMIDTEYYAPTIQVITGIIGLLGLWIILAPSVLPQAVFSSTHIVVGGAKIGRASCRERV